MQTESDKIVPTIADVARHAQVSTATVSRCLNTPDLVQEKTRQKVLEAVEELGYTPNFGARALVARRTNTIGAVIPTMENAIFARGLQAFQETLNARGVTLLVASSQYRPDLEEEQIRTLIARGVDGILLIGYRRSEAIYRALERRGIATLVAWACDPASPVPAVGFDNGKAMAALTRAVLARGHRRLAVISAQTEGNDRASERVAGVRLAMREAGLDAAALPLVETVYSIDAGGAALSDLMARSPRPTAVLCGNDVLAVGAIRQARRMGLGVPGDVSITGFDDIELATVIEPELTTVHVPHREMGTRAALALLEMIGKPHAVGSVALETRLCLRASLGPAPADRGQ